MTNGEILQPCGVANYTVDATLAQTMLGVCSWLASNGRQEFYESLEQEKWLRTQDDSQESSFNLVKFKQELESLFESLGIRRVVLATQNDKKCGYTFELFKFLGLTVSTSGDDMPFFKGITGNKEPDWKNALAVAWHKVISVANNLVKEKKGRTRGKRERKPDTVVFGGDIVVGWINELGEIKYLGNLSRERKLNGTGLKNHIAKLVGIYSRENGATIVYEVAFGGSIKRNGKVIRSARGARFKVKLRQVPEKVVRSFFTPDEVGKILNIAAGVKVVALDGEQSLYDYVESVEVTSLDSFYDVDTDQDRFELRHPANIKRNIPSKELDPKKPSTRELLRLAIIGNVPPNIVDLLLDLREQM